MPLTIDSSGTPEDPCSTSGTGTAVSSRATSSSVDRRDAFGHRVRGAHCDGERADAGLLDEPRRLVGIGTHTRRMGAILAADLAELGLDQHTGGVGALDDPAGRRDVVGEVELRPVVHHGSEAAVDRQQSELGILGVVEVHGDGRRRCGRHCECRQRDRFECAVIADAVLGDLEDHRQARCLRCAGERFGCLEVDDVERADTAVGGGRLVQDRTGGRQRHEGSSSIGETATSASSAAWSGESSPACGMRTALADQAVARRASSRRARAASSVSASSLVAGGEGGRDRGHGRVAGTRRVAVKRAGELCA